MSRPPLCPEWIPPYRTSSSPSQLKSCTENDHDWVFRVSSDLLCPISHEVFSNPVINVAGQIYERANIEQHFLRHNTDPVTGSRLQSKALTPVYSLKSRAAEFREAAARRCVEVATAVGRTDAVKYVRRASELCEALSGPVPGLSKQCIEYIRGHPSNIYDSAVMHAFAEGLCSAGQQDRAAAVFFTLLQAGDDRSQQAEMLSKFVECWEGQESVDRLVKMLQQSSHPSPAQLVKIAQEAGLNFEFMSKLCEAYLTSSASEPSDDKFFDPREWNRQKSMILQYTQLCCDHMTTVLQKHSRRMDEISEESNQLRKWLAQDPRDRPVQASQVEKKPRGKSKLQWAAAMCLTITCVLRPELVGVRVAKAASVAILLQGRR